MGEFGHSQVGQRKVSSHTQTFASSAEQNSYADLFIVGDCNMRENSPEESWFLDSRDKHGFQDCWTELYGETTSETVGSESSKELSATIPWDDFTNQPERIDRIFHRPKKLRLREITRLGRGNYDPSPSDHFGLRVILTVDSQAT